MTKSNNQPGTDSSAKPTDPKSTDPKAKTPSHQQGVGRETIESIAFAFVLALLFRSFVAEAFVIPTGSMAPTLYGRNKDVVCPACGHGYAIGASEEVTEDNYLVPSSRVDQSVCPNCRHMHSVRDTSVFKGDRILVNKSSYQFGEPDRWDVIVFRYPEDTQKNYIKRLVGLPGETIRIERGDVYAAKGPTGEFHILRKQDPNKQKLLQQVVYDDRHPPTALLNNGWPEAWKVVSTTEATESGWKHNLDSRQFEIQASATPHAVRYEHLVPSLADWAAAESGKPVTPNPRPQLVSDFCGYNAYTGGRAGGLDDDRYWVGDLTLSCTLKIASVSAAASQFVLELNEGVRRYRCRIDLTTGEAKLTHSDDLAADPNAPEIELAKAQTSIKGPGTYTLRFANVDDRLCLWVNDNWVSNGLVMQAAYDAPANHRPQMADLAPAAFSAEGVAATVSDLLIERDIYYRAESVSNEGGGFAALEVDEAHRMHEALKDPQVWGQLYEDFSRKAQFNELGPDEFFVMGDNSPRSQDSRLWPNTRRALNRHAVGRQALIGKAFFIYWPHGVPFMNDGRGYNVIGHMPVSYENTPDERKEAAAYPEYSVPFYPQWWRWKRIR